MSLREAPYGNVNVVPDSDQKELKMDFVVLSVGGNDFALRGEMDPSVILGFVR